ncbi:MAG: F0F1 ATP synthase subunit epsilon [Erysipelotrichaceae bacterium]|nr:F0F1 ATP synthase subunit epsilon [Erysipelotrichaceae bacterium]
MIKVKLVTPDGVYKETEATMINCCSTDGWRGILSNHMPIVLMLQISRLELVNNNQKEQYAIAGGMLYFENNEATILVDSIESKEDIDIERAKAAKARAEEKLASKDKNYDIKRAEIALARAINRISVSNC